jgi:hypothetical protein
MTVWMAAAGLTALSVAGCSTTYHTHASDALCKATGGTYTGSTCQPGKVGLSAEQMCKNYQGVYLASDDKCYISAR